MLPRTAPRLLSLLVLVALVGTSLAQEEAMPPKKDGLHAGEHADVALAPRGKGIDYLRDIRPILTQHCYGCHGPDEEQRATDLRFDLKASAFGDLGDGTHAIMAGDVARSEMIVRLKTEDADLKMPPPDEKDPISAAELALLERWVESGASWKEHWAFQPIAKPDVPQTGEGWAENPIDRFVSRRLGAEGITPNDPADREALIRRVSFDLTGLPPSPAEIDAFLADAKPGAYERVVDRLLASERYGERQAQDWLDAARYADTDGYQSDRRRSAWKWREWVVKAFNANQPFDQFAVEQLAGDLLEKPTLAQKIATGFNRNHPTNSEAGSEPDEYRSQYVIDRANTAATAFLGLTMGCAQCHDHKFDPISQKEFFGFYAYFNQVKEGAGYGRRSGPRLRVPNPDQAPHLATLEAEIKTLKSRLEDADPIADSGQASWEQRVREHVGEDVAWNVSEPVGLLSRNGAILRRQDDGSILATGEAPVRDTYELTFKPGKGKISAIRIEVLPHESLPLGGSGRSRKGEFILSGLKMRLSSLSDSTDPPLVFVARADTSLNQEMPEFPGEDASYPGTIGSAIIADDSKEGGGRGFRRGWRIVGDERMKAHEAILVPLETLVLNDSSVLRLTLEQKSQPFKTQIGRFRVSFAQDDRIRSVMLPAHGKVWSSVGPFPAEDARKAHGTEFEPEKGIKKDTSLDLKATFTKVEAPKPPAKGKGGAKGKSGAKAKPGAPTKPGSTLPKGKTAATAKVETSARPTAGKPAPVAGTKGKKTPTPKASRDPKGSSKSPPAALAKMSEEVPAKKTQPAPDLPEGFGLFGPLAQGKSVPQDAEKGKSKGKGKGKSKGKSKKGSGATAKGGAKSKAAKPEEKATSASKSRGRKREPAKLAWKKQQTWRDDRRVELDASNHQSWYLTRKVESTRARTVQMRFDGPEGIKAWLNGVLVFQVEPAKAGASSGRDARRSRSSSGSREERKVRLGLREGTNELVVKVTFSKKSASSRRGGRSFGGGGGFDPEQFGNLSDEEISELYAQRRGGSTAKGRFTFSFSPEGEDVLSHEVVRALRATPPVDLVSKREPDEAEKKRIAKQRKIIRKWFRENLDPVGKMLAKEKRRLEGEKRSLERKMPETLVMEELPKEKMRKTQVFVRGDYRQRSDEVVPHIPEILPDMPAGAPQNRLGLARWIVAPENPLTARVIVNRIWKQYFGLGFVRTAEDFGVRSETPTHPELLDYLARDLIENGWDLKRLHRMIATSATYRQSARTTAELRARDPENRLLARGPRRRLSAEMIRDAALSSAGLIVHEVGGPSVRPYQPEGLYSEIASGMRYRREKGEKQYRRGLYVFWKRGAPYPSMITFDAAKREVCAVDRAETTTPLQALVLLNDPVYVEAAKVLGQRLLDHDAKKDEERLAFGYRLCTSRQLDAKRQAILLKLLKAQRAHFADKPKEAEKLLGVGDAKVDTKKHKASELAAWTSVGSALLNLDAALHR